MSYPIYPIIPLTTGSCMTLPMAPMMNDQQGIGNDQLTKETTTKENNNTNYVESVADIFGNTAPLLVTFYLLLFCNFTPELVGRELRTLLQTSLLAKHILGIILMFFLVILADPNITKMSVLQSLGITAIIYAWFYLSTRCNLYITIAFMVLLLITYFSAVKLKSTDDPEAQKRIKHVRDTSAALSVAVSIAGAIISVQKHGIVYET